MCLLLCRRDWGEMRVQLGKTLMLGKIEGRRRRGRQRMRWLDGISDPGHEFALTPGVGDDREAWCAAVYGGANSRTWLSNWTKLNCYAFHLFFSFFFNFLCVVFIFIFFNYYFYFILLYSTILVLPYIDMDPPRVYMCSPSCTLSLPIPSPEPGNLWSRASCLPGPLMMRWVST